MAAETIAAALRKGNKECFTCGNKNHLKRDGPNKAKKKKKKKKKKKYIKIKTSKNLPSLSQRNSLGQRL